MQSAVQRKRRGPSAIRRLDSGFAKTGEKKSATDNASPGPLQQAGPVQKLSNPQSGMTVGPSDDGHERQANQVAQRVMDGEKAPPITPVAANPAQRMAEPSKTDASSTTPSTDKKDAPIQRAADDKDKKSPPIQKAPANAPSALETTTKPENKPQEGATGAVQRIQRAPDQESEKPQTPIRKAPLDQTQHTPAPASAEKAVAADKGGGNPIKPSTLQRLEDSIGQDLGGVRVHDDAKSQEAASDMNAKAFTQGNDIYLGKGASQDDVGLMAHEAAHTVQQGGGGGAIQRGGKGKGDATSGKKGAGADKKAAGPVVDAEFEEPNKIIIPTLKMPNINSKRDSLTFPYTLKGPTPRADQRKTWIEKMGNSKGLGSAVGDFIKKKKAKGITKEGKPGQKNADDLIYFLKRKYANSYYIGTTVTLPPRLSIPDWHKKGAHSFFQVDHIKELQLGGDDNEKNYQLLEAGANMSSGSLIKNELEKKITGSVSGLSEKQKLKPPKGAGPDELRQKYTFVFKAIDPTPIKTAGKPDQLWTYKQIEDGEHLEEGLTAALPNKELIGSPNVLKLYPREQGSKPRDIPWDSSDGVSKPKGKPSEKILEDFSPESITYTPGEGGAIHGTKKFKEKKKIETKKITWAIREFDGLAFTTYIDKKSVFDSIKNLNLTPFSPVEIYDVDVNDDGGEIAKGVVRPTLPFLKKNLDIDLTLESGELTLSKTFYGNEFDLPKPISLTGSSLTIALGTAKGLSISGEANFEIEKVGSGYVKGAAATGTGEGASIELEGAFNFDTKLFTKAEVKVWYKNGDFGMGGTLAIGPDKVKGIKSAEATVSYTKGVLTASGTAVPAIPGVKSVTIDMSYSEKDGFMIAGGFEVEKVKGIKSGSGKVKLEQKPGAEGYSLSASGTAIPDIPGIDSSLTVTYENGIFTAEANVGYKKGMLAGSVTVGVTNRPVAQGKPAGETPGKDLTIYGGGSLTIKIAPWLQATAGVTILPDGEVEVMGKVGLPSTINLFPEKKFEKEIFKIGIDIPIVGVAVAGQRIGIFATIQGGLQLSAGIGPGQLRQLELGVKYNPKHEDQTEVTGGAEFVIPAHAGLRLFVRGGLGVGIPIVSATAGIEVGGSLGLEGALTASAKVNWTPKNGLVLDAVGGVYVEPKFKFDIKAYVDVSADLWITTIELYHNEWNLASVEYGSGLRLGMKMPVHYEEGKELDLSMDKIEWDIPKIDAKEVLSGLIEKLI